MSFVVARASSPCLMNPRARCPCHLRVAGAPGKARRLPVRPRDLISTHMMSGDRFSAASAMNV